MKKATSLLIVVCFMVVLLPAAAFAHTESDPFVTDLIAGQYYDAGDVLVWNDADTLYVVYLHSYTGDEEWKLAGTHLHVCNGPCPDCIPQRNGNPPPGRFNYTVPNISNYHMVVYEIPLADIPAVVGDTLCIAAHAEVDHYVRIDGVCTYVGSETAWAKGEDFPGKNWAMYFTYEVQEVLCPVCADPGGPYCPAPTYQPWCNEEETCSCLLTAEGDCFCHQVISCADSRVIPCETSADCPLEGWRCAHSCCGTYLCHPPCGYPLGMAALGTGGTTTTSSGVQP